MLSRNWYLPIIIMFSCATHTNSFDDICKGQKVAERNLGRPVTWTVKKFNKETREIILCRESNGNKMRLLSATVYHDPLDHTVPFDQVREFNLWDSRLRNWSHDYLALNGIVEYDEQIDS